MRDHGGVGAALQQPQHGAQVPGAVAAQSGVVEVLHPDRGDHGGAAAGAGDHGRERLAPTGLREGAEAVQQAAMGRHPEADRDDDVVPQHAAGLLGGQH